MSNFHDTCRELRGIVDGAGSFMTGHQIINSNRARRGPKRKKAKWAHDDKIVQKVLLRVFPRLESNEKHRIRAGRWMRLIHLYYRSGLSCGDIAIETGTTSGAVRRMLTSIRRAVSGRPCNGVGKTRKRVTTRTSLGSHGDH